MFNWDIHRKLSPVCVNDVAAVLKSLFFFFYWKVYRRFGRAGQGSGLFGVSRGPWGPKAGFKPRRFPANSGGKVAGGRKVRKSCGKVVIRSREV